MSVEAQEAHEGCIKSVPNIPRSAQGSLRPRIALGVFNKDISLQDTSVKFMIGHLSWQEITYHYRPSTQWQAVSFWSKCDRLFALLRPYVSQQNKRSYGLKTNHLPRSPWDTGSCEIWSYAGGCVYYPDHASVNRTIADTTSPKWFVLRTPKTGGMVLQLWLLS